MLIVEETIRPMKKIILWGMYWLFIAFMLLTGLDNPMFQPAIPGLLIGTITLASTGYLLVQTKRYLAR